MAISQQRFHYTEAHQWNKDVLRGCCSGFNPASSRAFSGKFSTPLVRYDDFQVNRFSYESTDLILRTLLALFSGVVIVGWVVSVGLGLFSIIKWLTARNVEDTEISDLTDMMLLSLDEGWLKRLERTVKEKNGDNSRKSGVLPSVYCCIIPEKNLSKCLVVKKKGQIRKQPDHNQTKTAGFFRCVSGLAYNLQFVPRDNSLRQATKTGTDIKIKIKTNSNTNKSVRGRHEI